MAAIPATDATLHACPFNAFQPCIADRCMAWTWMSPRYERAITDNLVATNEGLRPSDMLHEGLLRADRL